MIRYATSTATEIYTQWDSNPVSCAVFEFLFTLVHHDNVLLESIGFFGGGLVDRKQRHAVGVFAPVLSE